MVKIIGAGLAGCEAACYIASHGHKVELIDCKPQTMSPAHKDTRFAELVCSNSLKSCDNHTASGLLKAELNSLGCMLLKAAERSRVPAGSALAVNREIFADIVTNTILNERNITVTNLLADTWDKDELTVIATGPLTMGKLNDTIFERLNGSLSFYDAAAPVIDAKSIDYSQCFTASRYGKGDADYINCPLNKEEYELFVTSLVSAEKALIHDFDKREIFEGCMPVEVMAERGADSLRFGPLRPVGFTNPATGKRPYAVVQLRAENAEKTMYNIVGFQTNLKFGEQKRVFSLIPALKNAEYLRYGVMHRNTYINSPRELDIYSRLINYPLTFIAGQLSGVEGYVESIASGLYCGINVCRILDGKPLISLPAETIIGSLYGYITSCTGDFQPMNANFGILPPLSEHIRDKEKRKEEYFNRSMRALNDFQKLNDLI